jgi:hypothetical protein
MGHAVLDELIFKVWVFGREVDFDHVAPGFNVGLCQLQASFDAGVAVGQVADQFHSAFPPTFPV